MHPGAPVSPPSGAEPANGVFAPGMLPSQCEPHEYVFLRTADAHQYALACGVSFLEIVNTIAGCRTPFLEADYPLLFMAWLGFRHTHGGIVTESDGNWLTAASTRQSHGAASQPEPRGVTWTLRSCVDTSI